MFPLGSIGFDFDQTLADSKLGVSSCLEMICKDFKIFMNYSEIEKLAVSGLTLDSILCKLFKSDDIDEPRQKFLDLYPSLGVLKTNLLPGARELIDYLTSNSYPLILISAKSQRNLELSVKHLGLKFDGIYGGVSGEEKSKVMVENQTYVYIGDQLNDVIAANLAQALAILVRDHPLSLDLNVYPHMYFKNLFELLNSIPYLIK
jgi:phosphoglycolate phosphatase-like HAD superfamily hydrolase